MASSATVAKGQPAPLPTIRAVKKNGLTTIDASTSDISAFSKDMSLTWSGNNWSFVVEDSAGPVGTPTTGSGDVLLRGRPRTTGPGAMVVDRLKMGNSATQAGKTTLKAGLSFADGGSSNQGTPMLRMTLDGKTTYLAEVDYLYFAGADAKTGPIEFAIGYGSGGWDHLNGQLLVDTEQRIGGGAAPNDLYGAILLGGDGNDTLLGSSLADVMIGGTGFDNMRGGAGNDTFIAGFGDVIDGEDGTADKAEFSGSVLGYRFAVAGLFPSQKKYLQVAASNTTECAYVTDVENVSIGGADFRLRWGSDTSARPAKTRFLVVADDNNQTLLGGALADLISTKTKSSTVKAGSGNDTILLETWGFDALSGNSTVYGGIGDDRIYIESNNNTVYGDNTATSSGGKDSFLLKVGARGNTLYGNAGADDFFVYTEGKNSIDLGLTGKGRSDGRADEVYFSSETAARNTTLSHVGGEDFIYVVRSAGGVGQMTLAEAQSIFGNSVTDSRSYFWTTTAEMDKQAGLAFA